MIINKYGTKKEKKGHNKKKNPGAPTSSHIANLVFIPYDYKLWSICLEHKLVYTRFIDDLTFSSQSDFKELSMELVDIINRSPFKISHRKTFYSDKPVEVTGVVVKQNKLEVTNAFKSKSQAELSEAAIRSRKSYENRINKA